MTEAPQPSHTFEALVTHILNTDRFWVQPIYNGEQLSSIEHALGQQPLKCLRKVPKPSDYVCVKLSKRGWKRAQLKQHIARSRAKVRLVDYGEEMEIPVDSIFCLPLELGISVLHEQAIMCTLAGVKPGPNHYTETRRCFIDHLLHNKVTVNSYSISLHDPSHLLVDLSTTELPSFRQHLLLQLHGVPSTIPSAPQTTHPGTLQPEIGERSVITVSHIDDLTDFYVQYREAEADISNMMTRMKRTYTAAEHYLAQLINIGTLCCVHIEPEWYRAEIKQVLVTGSIRVMLKDFGCCRQVTAKQIYALDEALLTTPFWAIRCGLGIAPVSPTPTGRFCQELIAWFKRDTADDKKYFTAQFVRKASDRFYIELFDDSGLDHDRKPSTIELLVSNKSAINRFIIRGNVVTDGQEDHVFQHATGTVQQPQPVNRIPEEVYEGTYKSPILSKMEEVTVEIAKDPFNLTCLLAKYFDDVDTINCMIEEAYRSEINYSIPPASVNIGMACTAPFEENNKVHYYRARVGAIIEDEAEIFFVDYGVAEVVPICHLKYLLKSCASTPVSYIKCSFDNVAPIMGNIWDSEALNAFNAYFRSTRRYQCLIKQEVKHSNDTCCVVQLYPQNADVDLPISRELERLNVLQCLSVRRNLDPVGVTQVPVSKVSVPADFGIENLHSRVHGNIVINLQDNNEIRANSLILSYNSPVFENMFFNFEMLSVDIDDFNVASVRLFIETLYTGKINLNRHVFRDINKISHVFKVTWLITKCKNYFSGLVEDLRNADFEEMLFAFEEAYFARNAIKHDSNYLETFLYKISAIPHKAEIFIDRYMNMDYSNLSTNHLDIIVQIAGEDVQVLIRIMKANIEAQGLILDDTSKYLLETVDLLNLVGQNKDVFHEFFDFLLDELTSVEDLRMVAKLNKQTMTITVDSYHSMLRICDE